MPFAQGARSGLSYIPEVTFGVTPPTGNMTTIPYTGNSLNLTKEQITSAALTPDRMIRNDRHGNKQVAGDVSVELAPADFDPFLESAFMGSWSSNVLKVGTTLKTFSLEDALNDINVFRMFTGVTVGSLSLSVAPNQMATATMNLVGKDAVISTTSSKPTKTAASGFAPFDSCSGNIRVGNAGGTLTTVATITGIELNINNDVSPAFVVGSCSTAQLEFGMATVSGSVTAYVENRDLYDRFVNETETALEFTLSNPAGNRPYTFLLPRVKFNSGDMPVSGPKSRIMTVNFSAIYDSTTNTVLQVTRTVPTP